MHHHGGHEHVLLSRSFQVLRHAHAHVAESAVTAGWQENEMTNRTSAAALLLGVATVGLAVCPPAQAEPLTPLAPNEIHYMEQSTAAYFAVSRNPGVVPQ